MTSFNTLWFGTLLFAFNTLWFGTLFVLAAICDGLAVVGTALCGVERLSGRS